MRHSRYEQVCLSSVFFRHLCPALGCGSQKSGMLHPAGGQEGSLEDQWQQMGVAVDVLATAPDDEVLAEILALQSELAQQVCTSPQLCLQSSEEYNFR